MTNRFLPLQLRCGFQPFSAQTLPLCWHLVEFLKECKIVVSSRLHLNIFAACAGIPSVGLVRNQKNIDFANLFSFPYVSLDQLSENDICTAANVLLEDYEDMISKTADKERKSLIRRFLFSASFLKNIDFTAVF